MAKSAVVSKEAVKLTEIEERIRAAQAQFQLKDSEKIWRFLKLDFKNLQMGWGLIWLAWKEEMQETKNSVNAIGNSIDELKSLSFILGMNAALERDNSSSSQRKMDCKLP